MQVCIVTLNWPLAQSVDRSVWGLFEPNVGQFVIGVLVLLFMVLAFVVVRRWLRRRPSDEVVGISPEPIDVATLNASGPPSEGPSLELYHIPVRLSLLVLAPVGRDARLPAADELPTLMDQIVPGLMSILNSHQPEFRPWPPQLSSEGFTKAFFGHVLLPRQASRGTPWCTVAGKTRADGRPLLMGLVCNSGQDNGLGEITVDQPGKWLDIIRVKA